jgi:hypothetical protein
MGEAMQRLVGQRLLLLLGILPSSLMCLIKKMRSAGMFFFPPTSKIAVSTAYDLPSAGPTLFTQKGTQLLDA